MTTNDVCKQSRRRLVWAVCEERRRNRGLRVRIDQLQDTGTLERDNKRLRMYAGSFCAHDRLRNEHCQELMKRVAELEDKIMCQRRVIRRLLELLHAAHLAFAELHNWSWYSGKPERDIVDGLESLGLTWVDAERGEE